MKHHFKYAAGYINIDDENLYITSSGNWEETQKLTEKSAVSIKANKRRIGRNSLLYFILLGAASAAIAVGVGKGSIKFGLLMVLFFIIYKFNAVFTKMTGNRYKIPISKIGSITPDGDGLKINFRNETNEPDFEIVRKVEEKGVGMLMDMVRDKQASL